MNKDNFGAPKAGAKEEAAMPYDPGRQASSAGGLDEKQRSHFMSIDGVEGVGTGQDAIGNEAVLVFVRDQEAARRVPRTYEGKNVVVQVTGPIDALPR